LIEPENLQKFLKKYFANYYAVPVEESEEEPELEEGEEIKDPAAKKEKSKT